MINNRSILKNTKREVLSTNNTKNSNIVLIPSFISLTCKKHTLLRCSNVNEIPTQNLIIKWIEKNNGKVDNRIKISKNEYDGHFLKATKLIKKGQTLIQLPKACQLSSNTLNDNETYNNLTKDIPKELWAVKLAIILLHERTKFENSEFWMYIKTLPQGIAGIPIFYSSAHIIKQIDYEPVIYQINKRCKWLIEFHEKNEKLLNEIFNNKEIDMNVFAWAFAIATSRAFKIKEKDELSFLPLIDICNHSFNSNCNVDMIGNKFGEIKLITTADVENGDMIYINYGNMSNDEYLLDYGFIIKNNPFDKIELKFDMALIHDGRKLSKITKNDEIKLTKEKTKLLKKLNLIPSSSFTNDNLKITIDRQNGIDKRLIIAIRIISLDNVKFKICLNNLSDKYIGIG